MAKTGLETVSFDQQQATYLATRRVASLATVGRDGKPSLVPVCYAFDGERFFIALDAKPKSVPPNRLKRVRNIMENPQVTLLVDTYQEDWSRLAYLMIGGRAELEPVGTPQHSQAVALLREKYAQYREMPIEEQPVIAIKPTSVHSWRGAGDSTGEPRPDRRELDFASLARGRHVVRQFLPVEIPQDLIEITLEAARWAPSPHGSQPWRFVVITRQEVKERLASAMADDWRRNLEMDSEPAEVVDTRLRKSQQRILGSPVLVIPCLYLADLHSYPDPGRQEAETTMAVQSLGAAIQNMLISAYSLGLDTGWMCAPLFCPDVVRAALGLSSALIPHAMINMGYGAKDPPRRLHRPVADLVVKWE